jgi:imidazole glycerol-phosphate synthase subunit HisH
VFQPICGIFSDGSSGVISTTSPGIQPKPLVIVFSSPREDPSLKIPQIGWNTLRLTRPHALFEGIPTGENGLHAYFVHSYHLAAENPEHVVAVTDYGRPVTAFVADGNKAGAQFHPEKSQALGLALISNFLRWKP